jgi:hypothetical protein
MIKKAERRLRFGGGGGREGEGAGDDSKEKPQANSYLSVLFLV